MLVPIAPIVSALHRCVPTQVSAEVNSATVNGCRDVGQRDREADHAKHGVATHIIAETWCGRSTKDRGKRSKYA